LNAGCVVTSAKGILVAPDILYAAAMMREKELYYGQGDFLVIIKMLSTQNPYSESYRDVPNKLFMIKHGHIFKNGVFPSLYDPSAVTPDASLTHSSIDQDKKVKLSKDKGEA